MCGLCGVTGSYIGNKEQDIFKQLLMLSALRGLDSTGTIVAHRKHSNKPTPVLYTYEKMADHALNYISYGELDNTLKKSNGIKALMGHCRAATIGDVTEKNAHPFDMTHIIGMHNGTIRYNKLDPDKKYETDSEALFAEIDQGDLKEVLTKIDRSHTSDAYALTFIDKRNDTLNFIRNTDRPLWFAHTPANDIYWASEYWMLTAILGRNGLKIEKDMLYMVKPNSHVVIPLSSYTPTRDMEVEEDFIPPKPISNITYPPFDNDWRNPNSRPGFMNKPKQALPPPTNEKTDIEKIDEAIDKARKNAKAKNDNNYVGPYKGFNGQPMIKAVYLKRLDLGCMWCGNPAQLSDKIMWISPTEYACERHRRERTFIEVVGAHKIPMEQSDKERSDASIRKSGASVPIINNQSLH